MRKVKQISAAEQVLKELSDARARHQFIREMIRMKIKNTILTAYYEMAEGERELLCGDFRERKKDLLHHRGGSEDGSILLFGQRMPVKNLRMNKNGKETRSTVYNVMHDFDLSCDEIAAKVLHGISTRDYNAASDAIAAAIPIPKSTVSAAVVNATQKHLDEINGRDLAGVHLVAMFLDGTRFTQDIHILTALGVTVEGEKIALGIQEGSSENSTVCLTLFDNLLSRKLKVEEPFLAVIDGSRALRSALKQKFGEHAVIQRCHKHKKDNVFDVLPRRFHGEAKRRMNAAWGMNFYDDAKRELQNVVDWLRKISEPAAKSLEEGFEETLTLHKLQVPPALRIRFQTTNAIESLFSIVKGNTRHVTNWRGKNQALRWSAAMILKHEEKMRRVVGYKDLDKLKEALKKYALEMEK